VRSDGNRLRRRHGRRNSLRQRIVEDTVTIRKDTHACTSVSTNLDTRCSGDHHPPLVQINPPQANIGFQLSAVNDRPFNAEVSVAILPGSTKLTLQVWPTSSTTFQESDSAFAEHYQRIDQKYARMVTITFDARGGQTYGLSGEFNQGATPGESSFAIKVFNTETKDVAARSTSSAIQKQADQKLEALKDSQKEKWSVEAGPGS
jgi:hypothetical protein